MEPAMSKNQNNSSFPDSLLQTIDLPVIESAGGLVCNHQNHILLMFKRGRWDMPKGRVDDDGKKLSAIREVNEETGLEASKLCIEGKLVSTWHTTRHQNIRYMKKTHWYLMRYDGFDADTTPQIEEGIIECRWIHLSELPKYRDLMRARIEYVVDFWHENLAYTARP